MRGCDDIDVGEYVYGIFGRKGAGDDLSDSQVELLLGGRHAGRLLGQRHPNRLAIGILL